MYFCAMKETKIMCPECAKRGRRSWLASAEGIVGKGFIKFWCKKCREEIKIPIANLSQEE
mgnify:CR=1 FL=1